MILSDIEIKEAIASGDIEITGSEELYIGPSSVDLHLDNKAMFLKKRIAGDMIDISKKEMSADCFEEYNGWDYIIIDPDDFVILSSIEKMKFADNIAGFIQGRSSIARLGLNIHCAGYFDVGFEGTATLEITNFTTHPIYIPKGTRICQMVFARTGKPAEVPYSKKKDSKYQGQSGPTITKIYEDYKDGE